MIVIQSKFAGQLNCGLVAKRKLQHSAECIKYKRSQLLQNLQACTNLQSKYLVLRNLIYKIKCKILESNHHKTVVCDCVEWKAWKDPQVSSSTNFLWYLLFVYLVGGLHRTFISQWFEKHLFEILLILS